MEDSWPLVNWLTHIVSGTTLVGALAGVFPFFGATVALIYYSLCIYAHPVTQLWFRTRRLRKIAEYKKKTERLEAQELLAAARKKDLES